MTKLNQTIAIEKGVKSRFYARLTELNKLVQKADLFNGFTKTYQPIDEEGETLPNEKKVVQHTVDDVLRVVRHSVEEYYSVTARKDWSNCSAVGDIAIDGFVVVRSVPISHLLFLEKQITDLLTLFSNLPTLDDAEEWTRDSTSLLSKSGVVKTHRTKKVQKPLVLYDATPEHPAQTQIITEDVTVGYWNQIKLSGAIGPADKQTLIDRATKLLQAVQKAREQANAIDEVDAPSVGALLFDFLLKKEA